MSPMIKQPLTLEQCREWLEVTERNYAQRGYGMFTLEDRSSGGVVGFCGLVHPGGQPEPEVKYAFKRRVWGQGLASEAIPALLAFGHRAFGLARIIATVAPDHGASQRILHKCGATQLADRLGVGIGAGAAVDRNGAGVRDQEGHDPDVGHLGLDHEPQRAPAGFGRHRRRQCPTERESGLCAAVDRNHRGRLARYATGRRSGRHARGSRRATRFLFVH